MQVAIALHQSRWLLLSVRRMILCGYPAAEKQTEHDHTQNALVSVIAMFSTAYVFSCCIRIDLKRLSHSRTFRRAYYASRLRPILTRASGSLACGAALCH